MVHAFRRQALPAEGVYFFALCGIMQTVKKPPPGLRAVPARPSGC